VDLWGLEIILSPEATDAQKKEYYDAIDYLKSSPTATSLIERLENSSHVITVDFINDHEDAYDTVTKIVFWDPGSGLITGQGGIQTPALGLAHELGHAEAHTNGSLDGKSIGQIEAENLSRVETPIAKELGEPVRRFYLDYDTPVRVESSISTKEVIEGQRANPSTGGAVYRAGGTDGKKNY